MEKHKKPPCVFLCLAVVYNRETLATGLAGKVGRTQQSDHFIMIIVFVLKLLVYVPVSIKRFPKEAFSEALTGNTKTRSSKYQFVLRFDIFQTERRQHDGTEN